MRINRRLPNHFGSIRFLGEGRKNAYAVHMPAMLGHSLKGDITNGVYGHRSVEELKREIEKIGNKYSDKYEYLRGSNCKQ